jgi:hypothetical protein
MKESGKEVLATTWLEKEVRFHDHLVREGRHEQILETTRL